MTFYGTLIDATAYHAARANTAWASYDDAQKTVALIRGSDYVDQRYREKLASGRWVSMFPGERVDGRNQAREWPRSGAKDYSGWVISSSVVPTEVIHATYEAALREAANPGSLSPDYVPSTRVTQETIGPLTIKYADQEGADSTPNRPVIPAIDEIIAPVLLPRLDLPGVRVV